MGGKIQLWELVFFLFCVTWKHVALSIVENLGAVPGWDLWRHLSELACRQRPPNHLQVCQHDGCRVVSADPVPDYLSITYEESRESANVIIWTLLTFRSHSWVKANRTNANKFNLKVSQCSNSVWPQEALQQPQWNFCPGDLTYSSRVLSNYHYYHHEWWTFASPPWCEHWVSTPSAICSTRCSHTSFQDVLLKAFK